MKKLALFMILMLGICIVGHAEEVDLAGMSTDALIELRNQIDDEITARVGTDNELSLPEGYYVVGTDIASGSYEIKDGAGPDDPQYYDAWTIYIFPSQEKLDEYTEALRAYQSAYIDAQKAEASGEEDSYPTNIYIKDYLDNQVNIDAGKTGRIRLSEGQIMRVVKSWGNSELTITKSKGLFMD